MIENLQHGLTRAEHSNIGACAIKYRKVKGGRAGRSSSTKRMMLG
jgi:hypothetical protein